jgi:predicted dehydrogenase
VPGALNIGLIGCGRWGRLILRDLLSLGVRVSVVARGRSSENAAGAAGVFDSIAKLPRMDGYVVATPTSTHADVIEQLLPLRAPVFCEKPLCHDAARARRLAEAADGRLFVMDKWRYHDGVLALAEVARTGELGPVTGLRTYRLGWGHDYGDVDCVWTLLPHDLSIAREIFGRPLPPFAAVADRAGNGVMGIVVSCGDPGGPWHVAEIGARAPERRRSIVLHCRDGTASLGGAYDDHISLLRDPPANGAAQDPQPVKRRIPTTMPLHAELRAFADFLSGGKPPKSSAGEAAETVEMIAAIRRLAGI